MKKICFVITSPMAAVAYLAPHLEALQDKYAISVVTNTQDTDLFHRRGIALELFPAAIERPIRPLRDFHALMSLYRLFRAHRFDAVHSLTPKAGLLSMLAAQMAQIPVRVHWFTGQVWANKSGFGRWGLKQADRLIARLASHALVDSPSQRSFLLAEGVIAGDKAQVLGKGSVCGVDGDRFRPDPDARLAVRRELNIPDTATVLLYLGRLNRDKGITDLAKAYSQLASRHRELWLLLVGPDEQGVVGEASAICASWLDRLRFVGATDQPERFMAAADVFCLPSYREGFGSVVIEAAACGVPTVASRIYGVTDAVDENNSGLLHLPGDIDGMATQIERLIGDHDLRLQMGILARNRAITEFSQTRVTNALQEFYGKVL